MEDRAWWEQDKKRKASSAAKLPNDWWKVWEVLQLHVLLWTNSWAKKYDCLAPAHAGDMSLWILSFCCFSFAHWVVLWTSIYFINEMKKAKQEETKHCRALNQTEGKKNTWIGKKKIRCPIYVVGTVTWKWTLAEYIRADGRWSWSFLCFAC